VKKEFEAAADGKWQPAGPAPALKPAGGPDKFTISQRVAFDLEEIPDDAPEEPATDEAAAEGGPTLELQPEDGAVTAPDPRRVPALPLGASGRRGGPGHGGDSAGAAGRTGGARRRDARADAGAERRFDARAAAGARTRT
jgi:hypothetical protein